MTTRIIAGLVAGICTLAGSAHPRLASDFDSQHVHAIALDMAARTGSYAVDEQLLDRVERELTRRCMATAGLPYSGRIAVDTAVTSLDDEWHPSLNMRHRAGYGLFAAYRMDKDQQMLSDSDRYIGTLSAEKRYKYQRALMGSDKKRASIDLRSGRRFTFSTDGCMAEARTMVHGSPARAAWVFYALQDITAKIDKQVRAAPEYTNSLAAWTSCMNQRGYAYQSPTRARMAMSERYRQEGASLHLRELEITVAVADAECVIEVGLTWTAELLAKKHAEALDDIDQRDLQEIARLRTSALQRTAVLAPTASTLSSLDHS